MSDRSTAGLLVFLVVSLIIGLVVVMIIAWCKIFKKAGYHPGYFFIPGYGSYLSYKIAECGKLFFVQLGIAVVVNIISSIISTVNVNRYSYYSYNSSSAQSAGIALLVIAAIAGIILLIINIVYCSNLARVFGKSGGFAAGLFFLNPIFICILGFGSAQYYGNGGGPNYSSLSVSETASWTCPDCGTINPAHKGACECGCKKP